MKVYMVTCGAYDSAYTAGVYSTPEAAMAAHPPARKLEDGFVSSAYYAGRPGGWREVEDGYWDNGLDWDDAASITSHEVED